MNWDNGNELEKHCQNDLLVGQKVGSLAQNSRTLPSQTAYDDRQIPCPKLETIRNRFWDDHSHTLHGGWQVSKTCFLQFPVSRLAALA